MSEWEKIVCTSALTISGGLLVFCVGQIIQRFVLEPIQELKKTIAEIRFRLNYYADVHPSEFETAPAVLKERIATASEAFRESAIRLETYAAIIPLYDLCELVFRLQNVLTFIRLWDILSLSQIRSLKHIQRKERKEGDR
jgi:hypothetical protein